MNVSELIEELKSIGCEFIEHGGEHDKWCSPSTNKYFRIPRHRSKEIPTGTYNRIAKDAGLK